MHHLDPSSFPSPPGPEWDTDGGWYQPATIWGNRSRTTAELCQDFLEVIVRDFNCLAATAWSLDPVRQRLIPVALYGIQSTDLNKLTHLSSDSWTGLTVQRKVMTLFPNLRETVFGRSHPYAELLEAIGVTAMVSIPVLNTANTNQVLLVVNLFFA